MKPYTCTLLLTLIFFSCKKSESLPIPKGNQVFIIGSSIARGVGASSPSKSWAGLLAGKYTNIDFQNLSVGGYTTFHFLPDVFADIYHGYTITPDSSVNISRVIERHPAYVIISLTTNDVGYGYSPSEYMRNMKIITDSLLLSKIPYLVTSTTLREDFSITNRSKLLSIFVSLNKRYKTGFVDIMTAIADTATLRINRDMYTNDLMHPNDAGYEAVFRRIDSAFYLNFVSKLK